MKAYSLVFLLVLMSCGAERSSLKFSAPGASDDGGSSLTSEQELAFKELQTKVLGPKNCLACHSAYSTVEGLAGTFKAGTPEASLLFTKVESGEMPLGDTVLTTEELEIVREYINSFGEKKALFENFQQEIFNPDVSEDITVSFEQLKQEILIPSCVKCHSKITSEENFMKWVDQKDPMNSKVLKLVVSGAMPKGGPALSTDKQNVLRKYLEGI